MPKKRRLRIAFPLGGLDRKRAYRQSPPYSTPDALNVGPVGTLESRERGGSRPGLIQSHQDDLGSNPRFLEPMILAPGDSFTAWSDTFGGSSLAAAWTQATWATDVPSILQQMVSVDTSVADAAITADTIPIDTSQVYTAEMLIVPWNGAFHGTYTIYVRLDDTTPAIGTDGVEITLTMTGSGGVYTGIATSTVGGVADATGAGSPYTMTGGTLTGSAARPVWLVVQVTGDTVVVFLDGTQILSQAMDGGQNGVGVGLGLECTEAAGLNLANVFRVQYYSTGEVDALRSMLIASAGGNLWKETRYGRMTEQSYDLTVRDDVSFRVAQSGQKLYIADYGDLRITQTDGIVGGAGDDELTATANPTWNALGILTDDDVCVISNGLAGTTDGTYKISSVEAGKITLASAPGSGTCSFRIERAPKVYDPINNTFVIMTATDGQVPTGCPLIARHLDRIFFGGAEIAPGVWYAARVSDELDFDYSQTDSRRAVAGTASAAGVPGTAITAFVPHSDDYLIIGCRNQLWRLRGDPAYEGSLDILSSTIGIVGMNAWCLGPAGEMIFLSLDGIYILPPGGESEPISMSREVLPQELLNFDPNTTTVLLEYDTQERGVHIYLTPDSSNTRIHWWFDWERKTFWPRTYASDHEPTATCSLQATAIEDSGVILGGRDGILRRHTGLAETDSGTTFETYMSVGPIPLAADSQVGILTALDAVIAENSGDVTWGVYPALTFEAATSAPVVGTGIWVAGLNAAVRPSGRGQAFMLRLTGATGRRWALEQVIATVDSAGPRRIA